ncbi:hypothetical protein [Thiocystis violacea]|uniref:hypothetical protein n=1 Tax=Thiocystis violacea TaxID=13725 RepID=UPI001906F498|nr:hypothetical protein [Thiocystis violacea]
MTLPKTDHMGLSAAKKYSSAGIMPAECATQGGGARPRPAGSVPAGVPNGIDGELIDQLQARSKQVLLGASGAPFAEAVTHGPDIIKRNIDALVELVDRPP